MKTLLQYLADLARDPVAQQAFEKDPEGAIASAELSEQDKQILRTRNSALIQATVGKQAADALIYAAPAQLIYAAPLIYAHLIYAPLIYGQPPAAQPPLIYAQPHLIYAAPLIYAQAPLIYAPAKKPDDEK